MPSSRPHPRQAIYVISVAAELAEMHPQTLRIYERKGLLDPARTTGGNRRYSDEDISMLRRIAELTATGLNLVGVKKVMELEMRVAEMERQLTEIKAAANDAIEEVHHQYRRDLVPLRQSVAVYRRPPRS